MAGFAANLAAFSESQIVATFLKQLDTIFGAQPNSEAHCDDSSSRSPATNSCLAGFVFDWSKVPFVRGGYSFPSVHESPEARALYARPEFGGRLQFAGEASDHEQAFMTMHSAIRTGERAAKQIAAEIAGISRIRDGGVASRLTRLG